MGILIILILGTIGKDFVNSKNNITPINLRELIRPLYRSRWLILISFVSVVGTVAFLTLTSKPVYEASAILSIREGAGLQGDLFGVPNVLLQKYRIKNEVAVLKSRKLAASVIKKLEQSSYKDSLSILGNCPQTTPSLREKIFAFLKKKKKSVKKPSFPELIEKFRGQTKVSYGRDTDIIELKGRAPSPWEAAYIVNTWVTAYQDYNLSDTRGEVVQTKNFLKTKLQEIEKKLAISEQRLANYKKQKKVVSLSTETEQLVVQLSSFESLYNKTKTDQESVEKQLAYLKSRLDENKKSLVEDMVKLSNPVLEQLQKNMAKLEAEKAAYEAQLIGAGYTSKGDVKLAQMENRLSGIKKKIVEETKKLVKSDLSGINPLGQSENLITQILELKTTRESLNAKLSALKSIINDYTQKLEALPDKSLELARLERDVQVNTKIYVMLREKYEEARIKEAGQISIVRVVDMAEPPVSPVSPKVYLNLFLGVFFGLLLGIAVAYGREYFEDSIKKKEDLEEMGLRVLGTIPAIKKDKLPAPSRKHQKNWNIIRAKEVFPYLITHKKSYSTISEAYRAIRTSIYFSNRLQKRKKTILLTSPGPWEGKSTTTANLAITMAQKGLKTLLVDSDLRRPILDVLFTGSHRKVGLTNYLAREINWQEAVRETTVNGLYLIPAGVGVKNASEILSSKLMWSFIEEVKKEYGIVLFDSPPLLPVTDGAVLAALVDGVILIAKMGKTSRDGIKRSIDILKDVNAKIIGTVLTGVRGPDYYGYKDYYNTYAEMMDANK